MSDPASGSNRSFAGLALLLARSWWPQLAALAFACGIVAMTIAGALGVGDAMEAGLRQLAIGRLGRINAAVASDRFFTLGLAERLQAARGATAGPATIVPAIVSRSPEVRLGPRSWPATTRRASALSRPRRLWRRRACSSISRWPRRSA
jgi:hypothetical protein